MKKLFLLALLSTFLQAGFSQIKTATVNYSMDYSVDEATEDGEDMASFFEGSTMEVAFNENCVRTDIKFGMLMSMTVIANSSKDKGLILLSTFGVNYAVPATLDQIMETDPDTGAKPTIQLVSGSKKILKYKCKKALQIDDDGNITTIWYTTKLSAPVQYFGMVQEVPGVPLEIESNNQGMKILFTATEVIKGNPDEGKFSLEIPEDYEEMSYEEFNSLNEE